MMQPVALGIDIGGTNTKIALVGREGGLVALKSVLTAERGTPDVFLPLALAQAEAMCRRAGEGGFQIAGIGIAVAGLLDAKRDRLVYNPNLAPLEGYPLAEAFRHRFDLPVVLEVDSNAACLAEARYGAGANSSRFLSIVVGTGLGGGMTVDGRLLRLAYECIGDVGHVIVESGGPPCGAGCRGCAEALVSAGSLEARAVAAVRRGAQGGLAELLAAKGSLDARDIVHSAHAGDSTAVRLLADTGRWLGLAVASLATIFFPDTVAISGGLSEAGGLLLGPAQRAFRESAAPFVTDRVTLRKACLGWKATVVGAAAGVWEGANY